MTWNELRVDSWHELTDALEEALDGYRGHISPTYVFRGQPNAAWVLEPSLLRILRGLRSSAAAREIEKSLETEFAAQAALYPETAALWLALINAGKTELWAFMQHHGCATRLLDWTASAFVAAYFAVNQCPTEDGALFVVAPEAVDGAVKRSTPDLVHVTDDNLLNPTAERVVFTWPNLRPQRVVAQQGHFSVNTNLLSAHDGPILKACASTQETHPDAIIQRKIIINADLKMVVLQQLRAMNIAPHALFPTLDGLGQSLSDLAKLRTVLDGDAG
jgi:hypothetical protein